jgi:hypothetical protein
MRVLLERMPVRRNKRVLLHLLVLVFLRGHAQKLLPEFVHAPKLICMRVHLGDGNPISKKKKMSSISG